MTRRVPKNKLAKADIELEKIGYLQNNNNKTSVILIEFRLKDVPGSVTDILTLISEFNFNISYISSQENGTDYQLFKMGLYVEDAEQISHFITEAEKLCHVRIIDYNSSEKIYDNSIFYSTYVLGLSQMMGLSENTRQELLVNVNLTMQTLDEQGLSPYRTFDSISKFAELLSESKGKSFVPRISTHEITPNTSITLIEPPCGSNTIIINSNGKYLFIDSGYACYKEEMREILKNIVPDYDTAKKSIVITHADVDHCGLLSEFDEIIVSQKSANCLKNEFNRKNGYREQNPLHKPYVNICKTITSYLPPEPQKLKTPWEDKPILSDPLTQIGFFDFEELHFEVYEGKGGHLPGEIVLIDYTNHIAFTGDVYINVHALTKQQAEYNQYAPILMTSVDTDPALCAKERQAILQRLGIGEWQIFGSHSFKKDYKVTV